MRLVPIKACETRDIITMVMKTWLVEETISHYMELTAPERRAVHCALVWPAGT